MSLTDIGKLTIELLKEADYQTNIDAKLEIEELAKRLNNIEIDKLDKIIEMLIELKKS